MTGSAWAYSLLIKYNIQKHAEVTQEHLSAPTFTGEMANRNLIFSDAAEAYG